MNRVRHNSIYGVVVLGVLLAGGCADKPIAPAGARSPVMRVQFQANIGAQVQPTQRTIDVRAVYDRTSGERVVLGSATAAVIGTSQNITMAFDLSGCLADENRAGARDLCPLRIAIALRDTSAIALDSVELGPYDASLSHPPDIAPIDLAIERFTARSWAADQSLRIGGADAPQGPTRFTGLVIGPGMPALYSIALDATGSAVGVFEGGSWRVIPIGLPGTNFTDIAMVSPTEGWLASSTGLYRFNGTSASVIPEVVEPLTAAAAITVGNTRLVIAVGVNGSVWRGDGTTWTHEFLSPVASLQDVCITGANEAFAASADGASGLLWRWDGTQWSLTSATHAGAKSQLQCTAPGQASAYSFAGGNTALLRWNGSSWTAIPTAGLPGVNSVSAYAAASPTEIYGWGVAPDQARAWYRFDGTAWTEIARSGFGQGFGNVWADPRGGRVFIAPSFGRIEMYDAASSQRTVISYVPAVRDVMFSSPTNGVATGWNLFFARWNGVRWTVDPPPTNVSNPQSILQAAWTDGPSNAWVAGGGSKIFHWNGAQWLKLSDNAAPIAGSDDYTAIWGSGGTVFITGIANVVRCSAANICVADVAPGVGTLRGIWGSSLSNVIAVGSGGRIIRYDGSAWTQMQSPTSRDLVRVWGSAANDVWAVGDSTLLRFDGTTWSNVPMTGELAPMQTATNSGLQVVYQIGLWGSAKNDVYLGSNSGVIARFDGTTWRRMQTPTTRRIIAIAGAPGFGALALTETQSTSRAPTLLRGVGPTGGFASPLLPTAIWP